MKPTTTHVQKSSPAATPASHDRSSARDELLALRCMNAALTGLLAANSARDDGMFWDNLQMDELTDQALDTGLMLFVKFKQWAQEERSVCKLEEKA